MYNFDHKIYPNGIEVCDSYKTLFSWCLVTFLHDFYPFTRSRLSMCVEWALHSVCYWLGIERERAKDVFLEYGDEWLKNLFKR